MDQEKLQEAEKKIQKILMDWFTTDAVLLNLYSMFNFRADKSQETFGINVLGKHPVIVYNPNFVNSMPLEHLEMVMVHTGFKVLLRHCTSRLKEPRQISALSSNITVDELIYNNTLNFLASDESLKDLIPTAKQFGLPEKDCFEEYFRQLYEKQEEINKMIKEKWDSMTDEEKQELIDNAQKSRKCKTKKDKDEGEDQSNEQTEGEGESDGEGDGDGDGEGKDEEGFKEYNNTKDGVKDYFDPNGTANDGWGSNDMMDADIKNYIDKNKDRVKAWGKHTGDSIAEILAAMTPKISYKELIRKFKRSVDTYARVSSRLKINRRYDLALPGHRRFLKTRILFGLDVSGSMSDEDLAEAFAIINKIIKHAEIIYVQFDTEIKSIETKLKKAKSSFKVCGRGGTNFDAICQYADEIKCDGLVIFTDGYAPAPKQPKTKVLWLTHTKGYVPPVTWGMRATLDRFENNHPF